MPELKKCPLIKIQVVMKLTNEWQITLADCGRETCGFWDEAGEHCSIVEIAQALRLNKRLLDAPRKLS